MQERNQLTVLFQKYQQGLVNEEEKKMIARWLIQLELTGAQLTSTQLAAKAALSKSELKNRFFPVQMQKARTVRFPNWASAMVASLFIAVIFGGIYYATHQRKHSLLQTTFEQTVTQIGEMKVVTLPDGSKITLNNQSRLKYPVHFSGKTRTVYLTGEAFFNIVHDTKKPFRVYTDKLNIQVLGTSFNVSAYPDDAQISVAVATGKVGVTAKGNKLTAAHLLLPGDLLSYHRKGSSFSTAKLKISDMNSWAVGKLVFKNETLANITNKLQRHYKVTFMVKNNTLLTKRISLKTNNQDIGTLIKALSISGGFSYQMEGTQVTLW